MNRTRTLSACAALSVVIALLGMPLPALADNPTVVETVETAEVEVAETAADDAAGSEKNAAGTEGAESNQTEESKFTAVVLPAVAEVGYPAGATFRVEASDPEMIASYQWIANNGIDDFELDGTTATTNRLRIPSTQKEDPDLHVRCVLTLKDGTVVETEPAVLHVANSFEEKTVLYVGDHALVPGQSLDLAKTTLGTGRVAFSGDGTTITLEDVNITTSTMSYDVYLAPSFGLNLMQRNGEEEFHFNLVGTNVIENNYSDPDGKNSGIVFDLLFGTEGRSNSPRVFIEGEGTLQLIGGSCSLCSDSDVEVSGDLSTEPNGDIYCDAIVCRDLKVGGTSHLEIHANGAAFDTEGDLSIAPGAVVSARSTPSRGNAGTTSESVVDVDGSIVIVGATLNVNGTADPAHFKPFGATLASFTGISFGGSLNAAESSISIVMATRDSERGWLKSCYGIDGNGDGSSIGLADASTLSVKIDCADVSSVRGIRVTDFMGVTGDSKVSTSVVATEDAACIMTGGRISMVDATVDCRARSVGEEAVTRGIVCGGLKIECSKPGCNLRSVAEDGVALLAYTNEHGVVAVNPTAGYAPGMIIIGNPAVVLTPATGEVNVVGVLDGDGIARAETIYNPNDRSVPAMEVEIGIPDPGGDVVMIGLVSTAAFVAIARLATKKSRRVRSLYEEFRS